MDCGGLSAQYEPGRAACTPSFCHGSVLVAWTFWVPWLVAKAWVCRWLQKVEPQVLGQHNCSLCPGPSWAQQDPGKSVLRPRSRWQQVPEGEGEGNMRLCGPHGQGFPVPGTLGANLLGWSREADQQLPPPPWGIQRGVGVEEGSRTWWRWGRVSQQVFGYAAGHPPTLSASPCDQPSCVHCGGTETVGHH